MMTTKELKDYLAPDIDLINSSYLDSILVEIGGSGNEVLVNRDVHFDNSENPNDDNLQSNTDKGGLWDE